MDESNRHRSLNFCHAGVHENLHKPFAVVNLSVGSAMVGLVAGISLIIMVMYFFRSFLNVHNYGVACGNLTQLIVSGTQREFDGSY
jgi:hypothetical protein